MNCRTLLQISRPGLWLVFVWLYLWPTGGQVELLSTFSFWLGLLYCMFPLNLLVYGMNDLVDKDVDKNNPRKGNFIYGAKASVSELRELPIYILVCTVTPLLVLICMSPDKVYSYIGWLALSFGANFVYNNKPFQFSRKCPWEIPTMILGHFLIPILSCHINNLPLPPASSWIYHSFLLSRSHIWLEFADIAVDKKEKKRTVAVVLGKENAFLVVVLLTVLESLSAFLLLESYVLGTFALFGIFVFWNAKEGKVKQEKMLVSISQSIVGGLLMMYVWSNGVFSSNWVSII